MSLKNTQDKPGFPKKSYPNKVDKSGRSDGMVHPALASDKGQMQQTTTHNTGKIANSQNKESRGGRSTGTEVDPNSHVVKVTGGAKQSVEDVSANKMNNLGGN